jgi:lysylphosphatidylglycerol synthetase-like protein (DUF2156 family)
MTGKKDKKEELLAPKILTAQFLLFVNALLWLGFAIYLFRDMVKSGNNTQVITMISFFVLLNAVGMAVCGFGIRKQDPLAFYFTLFVVVLNAIFTRVGQFQVFNMIAFIVDLIILIVLLTMARDYLQSS